MSKNASIIGSRIQPTSVQAKGIWSLYENYLYAADSLWPQVRSSFLPVEDGLARWFDASYSPSLVDATEGGSPVGYDSPVTQWEDLSNNVSHATQTNPTYKPLRKEGVINGMDALLFNTKSVQLLENVSTISGATIFIVAKIISITNGGMHSFEGNINNVHHPYLGNNFYDNFATASAQHGFPVFDVYDINSPFCYSIVAGANWTAYINGNQVYSTAHTLSDQAASKPLQQIGRSYSGYWNGYIGEVIVYNTDLSNEEHATIANFLKLKWGIT